MKKVAIVILNWNGASMMRRFLPSVIEHSAEVADIVVADNASTDDSLALLRDEFPSVRTIVLDKNYGFAGGYNCALEQVDNDYYMLLNSDVEVTEGWMDTLLEFMDSHEDAWHVLEYGAAYTPYIIQNGEVYRLFTSMFLHFGIEHLVNNMLVLFVLGSRLERVIGKIRFLLIYLLGGIAGNVVSLLLELKTQEFSVSAGASGAVFAVMGAMIYIVIRNKGWLGDLSMRQILVMAAFSLYFGFTSSGVDNAAHIGGLLAGFVLAVLFWHPSGSRGIYT